MTAPRTVSVIACLLLLVGTGEALSQTRTCAAYKHEDPYGGLPPPTWFAPITRPWSFNSSDWSSIDDTNYAVVTLATNRLSYTLYITDCSFSLPENATSVDGIIVEAKMRVTSANPADNSMRMVLNDASLNGTEACPESSHSYCQSMNGIGSYPHFSDRLFGSSTDTWSRTWTVEEINSSGFGFAYRVVYKAAGSSSILIDRMQIIVHYTL